LGNDYLIGAPLLPPRFLDVIKLAGQPEDEVRIAGQAMEPRDWLTTSITATTTVSESEHDDFGDGDALDEQEGAIGAEDP
jgi:hypothetical protein